MSTQSVVDSACNLRARRQVPYFRHGIGEEEIQAVCETLRSDWLTAGPRVQQFEADFSAFVEAPFTIAVASCTAALRVALEALGVGPGDEVLVPTMTFASAVAVVLHLGARPVFVDCAPDTLTMDPVRSGAQGHNVFACRDADALRRASL